MDALDYITVLIADDHEVTRFALQLTLEQSPIFKVVAEVGDGQTAVDKTLELHPAVVLMDIGMPVLDGIDATKMIKATSPETKVLIFTSHDSSEDFASAMAAGADGYCLKDCSADRLMMSISTVVDSTAWADSRFADKVIGKGSAPSSTTPSPVSRLKPDQSNRWFVTLQTHYGKLDAQTLIKLFIPSMEALLAKVEAAVAKRDASSLEAVTNDLAGMWNSIKRHDMEAVSRGLKQDVESQNWEKIQASCQLLRNGFREVTVLMESAAKGKT